MRDDSQTASNSAATAVTVAVPMNQDVTRLSNVRSGARVCVTSKWASGTSGTSPSALMTGTSSLPTIWSSIPTSAPPAGGAEIWASIGSKAGSDDCVSPGYNNDTATLAVASQAPQKTMVERHPRRRG